MMHCGKIYFTLFRKLYTNIGALGCVSFYAYYPTDLIFVCMFFVHVTNSIQTIFNVGVSFWADFCKD